MSSSNLSRRSLLRGLASSGVAIAIPSIVPSSVFGENAPSKQVRVAMIGTGRQAYHANLSGFLALPEVRVVAACDVDRNRAEATKEKIDKHYGDKNCKVFTDWREAIAMDDLDAIMNSTPDHWHAIISIAAVKRGLHVSCEKPLTRYLMEGRAIADAAKKAGVVFRTDSECRSHGYMIKTANLAMNGYLGKITRFKIGVPTEIPAVPNPKKMPVPENLDYEMWLGPAPERDYIQDLVHPQREGAPNGRPGWMRNLDYCEGMITNWGTHLLDVASLINGSERSGPISVEGTGSFQTNGLGLWNTLEKFEMQYKYKNGVTIDYVMDVPYLRVEGEDGWIQAHWHSKGGLKASDMNIFRTKLKDSDIQVPTRSDKGDFISAIRNGTEVMADAEIGHRTCSIGQIGHILVQRGKSRMEWDPDTETFPGDAEANKLLHGTYRGPWKLQ
jgi:myo-inositol 2-dehydrogenase/D-chiro-inositol 1-dehydrogenase